MKKELSRGAYGGVAGKDYVPYIQDAKEKGGNAAVLIIGILLAVLFAASTAYSGMMAGLTVAAGIPGSILGSVLVAAFAKKKGILGKTLIQGMASGGESIASGMIFVFPAVLLIGAKISFFEGFIVGVGGVLFGLGIVALVYNYLIVDEHGELMYPESMAISETLVATDGASESVKYMGIGFGIGGILTVLFSSFANLCNNVIEFSSETFYKWRFQLEVNPLLIGIGFIVGLPVALAMFAGSILANFFVLPIAGYFTNMAVDSAKVWNDPSTLINAMKVADISGAYIKYIGAGIMLSGGIISAIKLIPVIIESVRETLKAKDSAGKGSSFMLIVLAVGAVLTFVVGFVISRGNVGMAILGAVLSMILSLLFVIVSGRLTGTIGTSNLPVSGMTIASVVIVTLLFVIFGWKGAADNKSLLLFGTFIVTAIAVAGGYSQSQKVSFIIGGDKNEMDKYYAIAAVVGVAIVTGVIILLAPQLTITGDNAPFALPQANLMATLTQGIMQGNLPWVMVIAGVFLGIVFYMLGLPVMTVAIGFYLSISTTSIILVGALLRVLIEKMAGDNDALKDLRVSNGISLSSGLVAGGSIIGLIGIILQVTKVIVPPAEPVISGNLIAFILLIVLCLGMFFPISAAKNVPSSSDSQE